MIHLGDTFAVLEDNSTTNLNSLFESICIHVVLIWKVVLDVEEFLLESDGVRFDLG